MTALSVRILSPAMDRIEQSAKFFKTYHPLHSPYFIGLLVHMLAQCRADHP
jgi:hypothetical protein